MFKSIARRLVALYAGSVATLGAAHAQVDYKTPYDSLPAKTAHLSLGTANQLQYKESVFAYVTRDSLHIGVLEMAYPTSLCAAGFPFLSGSKSFPLPGRPHAAPPPFALLAAGRENGVRAVVAMVLRGSVIRQVVAGGPFNFVLSRTDSTRVLHLKAAQVVHVVASARDAGLSADSSLVVAGSPGLYERIEWKGGRFGAQTSLPPAAEDFLRFGGGLFAGISGGLFRGSVSAAPARFRDAPPDILDSGLALWNGGETGLLVLSHEGSWSRFDVPPGEYRAVRLRRHLLGGEAWLYPPSGPPTRVPLGDRPLRMTATFPAGTTLPVAGNAPVPVVPGPLPDTLTVSLSDPDDNYSGVEAVLARTDGRIERLGPFVQSDGSGGCAGPGLCLHPGPASLTFVLGRDSVRARVKVREARFFGGSPGCGTIFYSNSEVGFEQAWSVGDTLRVRAGGQEVVLRNDAAVGIASRTREAAAARPFVLSRDRLLDSWPAWTGIGRGRIAAVHGADGRYLGSLGLGTDLRTLPAGLVFLRWRDAAQHRTARLPDRVLLH